MTILRNVEVLPGLDLALFPWEDPAWVTNELESLFDEIERQPGLGWEPTDEEIDAMFDGYAGDRWQAEYNRAIADGAWGDFAVAVADVATGNGVQWSSESTMFSGKRCPHCGGKATRHNGIVYECSDCGGVFRSQGETVEASGPGVSWSLLDSYRPTHAEDRDDWIGM